MNTYFSTHFSPNHENSLHQSDQFTLHTCPVLLCWRIWSWKGGFICPQVAIARSWPRELPCWCKAGPGLLPTAAPSWLTEFNWQEGKGYGLRDVTGPTVQSLPHSAIEVSGVASRYEVRCRLWNKWWWYINIHHVNYFSSGIVEWKKS